MSIALAAILSALSITPQQAAPAAPINLVVREEAGALRLTVVGFASTAYEARYTLDVAGQGPAGTNHTRQGGAATLKPGEATTLLSISLGGGGAGRWTATLTVTPADGAPYVQERRSPS